MAGRGKKLNRDKNARAHDEWMKGKRLGRRKQVWVWEMDLQSEIPLPDQTKGHWEKV